MRRQFFTEPILRERTDLRERFYFFFRSRRYRQNRSRLFCHRPDSRERSVRSRTKLMPAILLNTIEYYHHRRVDLSAASSPCRFSGAIFRSEPIFRSDFPDRTDFPERFLLQNSVRTEPTNRSGPFESPERFPERSVRSGVKLTSGNTYYVLCLKLSLFQQ